VIASLGGIAAIIAATVGALLMLVATFFLAISLFRFGTMIESVRLLVDGVTNETIPLLSEVTTTVRNVNRELDTLHVVTESTGHIVKSVERLTSVVEQTISSPLIKIAAAGYGFSRATRKARKQ
jgi:hypothetical protein